MKEISDKFSLQEFVVTVGDKYPQPVKFQVSNKNIEKISDVQGGDELIVHFNLRGREWENKEGEKVYFNSLDVWRIENKGQRLPSPADETPF